MILDISGSIHCIYRVYDLGLECRDVAGSFWQRDAPMPLQYSAQNPEFHIVTKVFHCLTVNRY